MGDDSSTAQPASTPKSKLNPFAREFKLNVKAPSFTPASKPAGSALPPGGAGQGPGPVPAASSQFSGGPRWNLCHTSSHQPLLLVSELCVLCCVLVCFCGSCTLIYCVCLHIDPRLLRDHSVYLTMLLTLCLCFF